MQNKLAEGSMALWLSGDMTAFEIIGQIKALPPKERAKVVGFIHELESDQPAGKMDRKTFEQSAKLVFDRHAELMHKLT